MKNLRGLFNECIAELESVGLDYYGNITRVYVNTRAKKRWGQCAYNRLFNEYEINISATILADEIPVEPVKCTIIHEILHTFPDCMCHTGRWKELANYVNVTLGYDVTRTKSSEYFGIEKEDEISQAKYIFVCEDCGQVITRDRMSKFVKYYNHYKCGKCGGKFKRKK